MSSMWMEASLPVSDTSAPRLFIVMGVSGCGKSTIAEMLAASLDGTFLDGDDFHPEGNIAKMSAGHPLTDEDRWPWLSRVASEMVAPNGTVVCACSALKRAYRTRLTKDAGEPICFVYLNGSADLIASRMAARHAHFMPLSLLESQFRTLEIPSEDELAIDVDISVDPDRIVKSAVDQIMAVSSLTHNLSKTRNFT